MTKAYLDAGSCGYDVTITVEKIDKNRLDIRIDTGCEMVKMMEPDLKGSDWKKILRKIIESPVYISASKRLKHPGCPVPMAIIKAIEVELGAALPKDVKMTFLKED
jgi:hypothetical protein